MLFTLPKKVKQRLKIFVFVVFGVYILLGISLYFLQEQILFRPTQLPQDYSYRFNHQFKELFLNTKDSAVINALHFKTEKPKGVILYFHGNAGDLSRWGFIVEYFVEKQYDVLVMDYRGFGKSTGKFNEQHMYEDAQMCYDYLLDYYPENQISIYGRSLGGSFATYVAAKNNPKQLVLEAPFYNVNDVAQHRFPFLPTNLFLEYKFLNNQYIKQVNCNIYIVHGTDDYTVPFTSGEKLYLETNQNKSSFIAIDSAGHNNLSSFKTYHEFINSVLP